MDYEKYYKPSDEIGDDFDIVMKNANFSWDKALTQEEREKLHLTQKKVKGKGKRKGRSFDQEIRNESSEYVFQLHDLDIFVRKVLKNIN